MADDTTKTTAAAPSPDDRPFDDKDSLARAGSPHDLSDYEGFARVPKKPGNGFVPNAGSYSLGGGDAKWRATLHSQVVDGELDIDDDAIAGGIDLTRYTREEIRSMSAEDLRRLIRQGHEADKLREQRDKAQDEALAALLEALDNKEAEAEARHQAEMAEIRRERDEARSLINYKSSTNVSVNMPRWKEATGNHAILVLLLVVLLTGGGGVLLGGQIGGGVTVTNSAEASATVIQAETVEGILGARDGWLQLRPEDRAAFRAEGIDPYATEEGE